MSILRALPSLALFMLLPMTSLWAADSLASLPTERYAFTAQPLASALAQFARQNHLQMSVDAKLLQDKMAPALNGELNEQNALTQLLRDSGLDWSITSERTLLLYPRANNDR
ncbi:hypothetical protein AFK24_29330 [Pseudomonas syringae]|uniref:Secretin/TonB short N-terminal domain-containing protein n=1 Tax=Pseudomonas syringae TaxID=317 RepID=A0A1C7YVE8_PSESX|nr:STN domain-containing protein [Pseudomonas syringae]OCR21651.1 hypothetical protein AFK24_29330 [Pseudomonas syringae]